MKKLLTISIAAFLFLQTNPAGAVMQIDITKGNVKPMPIAIPDMVSTDKDIAGLGIDISKVIENNLERSGLFKPIDKKAHIQKITVENVKTPTFTDWRQVNAQALVTGSLSDIGGGKVQLDFRLYDVLGEKQIGGKSFVTMKDNWRRVSHLVSDEIYKRLTGEEGYFDSRIVYISETGPGKKRIKRLAIMDQDGANHKFLTDGSSLVLTPRFNPESQQVIYMSYAGGKQPRVYMRDIETGREKLIGDFPGMSFAPRFSPDGKKAIMSVALNGNSDIYTLDLSSGQKTRITSDQSIDTSPSFSPDMKQVVFNSDRGGSQQIYTMNADGSNVKRISFGEGRYGTPVWSPRGDLVAFTKMHQGTFYIGVMRPDGSGERLLTSSWLVEGPTWAPNGRVIIFTRQSQGQGNTPGKSRLYSVDLTGYNEREIISPTDASDPAWSPLLSNK